ncbi:MAG: hypothetical protein ACE363_04370 [Alphaproteobacteria bacterium]
MSSRTKALIAITVLAIASIGPLRGHASDCYPEIEAQEYRATLEVVGRLIPGNTLADGRCARQIRLFIIIPFQRAEYPSSVSADRIKPPILFVRRSDPRMQVDDSPVIGMNFWADEVPEGANIRLKDPLTCFYDNGTGTNTGEASRHYQGKSFRCSFPVRMLEGAVAPRTRIFVRHDPTGEIVFDGDVMSGMPTGFIDNIASKQQELVKSVEDGTCGYYLLECQQIP